MRLQQVYEKFRDRADFWWIYVKEAHPTDGRRPSRSVKIAQHKSLDDRKKAAGSCVKDLKLGIPQLIDDMNNTVATAYHGSPDRLFILSPDATIAYRGDKGPFGFDVAEMEKSLEKLLKQPKSD